MNSEDTTPTIGLGELAKGASARIIRVDSSPTGAATRFLQMGLLEGATVEVLHVAPFSLDPIAVRVRGTLIALRRNEANFIRVVRL